MFGARKPCGTNDLLPLKFRPQMVSPIQNILTKNLETICRVILVKTSQKMIVNLLMMVWIYLPIIKFICQHHVSGYVCRVWHLRGFFLFFLLLIKLISVAKLLIIVHFFVWKHEKQTLLASFTQNLKGLETPLLSLSLSLSLSPLFTLWEHLLFCPNTENYLGLRGWSPWNYLVWIGLMKS